MELDSLPTQVQIALAPEWERHNLSQMSPDGLAMMYARFIGCDLGRITEVIDIHARLIEIERREK